MMQNPGTMPTLLEICAGIPERSFSAEELVIEEQQRSGRLYILKEGRVEVLKKGIRVATIGHPGAIFGDISILLNHAHSATVRCLTPSRFHVVENPVAFLEANPAASFAIARGLAERLDSLTCYLVDLKAQFDGQENHLGMIDEVLESLLHHQRRPARE
jgi:CRP-like cAMP-binding protein